MKVVGKMLFPSRKLAVLRYYKNELLDADNFNSLIKNIDKSQSIIELCNILIKTCRVNSKIHNPYNIVFILRFWHV